MSWSLERVLSPEKIAVAERFRGGVIMDVTSVEQAKIAESAGASAVMALERVPADIRAAGGVARMADPALVEQIMRAVRIPVMAKVRIGHFLEARVYEALGVDFIDESEVLTPADEEYHIDKTTFRTPFVCGARDLGEALRRIAEGAAMIRTKGEAGTGNIVEAVRHLRRINRQIQEVRALPKEGLVAEARKLGVPLELLAYVHEHGKLPVPNLAAGGVATPADAALMIHLGADGVFVGSGIFKSENPEKTARAIVEAVKHPEDYERILYVSKGLGAAMPGIDVRGLSPEQLMAERGL
ncbi:MAG: pyridoxal 5'-phosphate synthase lyase subunit PdxS [Brockia lithotrophica]|nr:pyridoxal 5'-phosphate synthase lyase subunit PdxS [Brockia lithotrophica]